MCLCSFLFFKFWESWDLFCLWWRLRSNRSHWFNWTLFLYTWFLCYNLLLGIFQIIVNNCKILMLLFLEGLLAFGFLRLSNFYLLLIHLLLQGKVCLCLLSILLCVTFIPRLKDVYLVDPGFLLGINLIWRRFFFFDGGLFFLILLWCFYFGIFGLGYGVIDWRWSICNILLVFYIVIDSAV
jgi:hypothetical protein